MMMKRTRIAVIGVAIAATLGVAGAGAATAIGGESETPITGDALTQASAAALAHTGGGRVSQTEVGDEDSYYEVEVTLADGSQVDVQLNRDFSVVGSKADSDTSEDGGAEN